MMILHRRHRAATIAVALASINVFASIALADTSPVWVFLRDKNVGSDSQLASAISLSQQSLSPEAITRRVNRGMNTDAVTLSDLPVSSSYVNQISTLGGNVRVQSKWLNAVSIDATPDQLARISALPFVDHVQSVIGVARPQMTSLTPGDEIETPPGATEDFYGAASSQLTQVNIPAVHALGYTGTGMRIGVLDSGFKRTHAAFNFAGHPLNVVAEQDFVQNDNNTADTNDNQHQHGTWVLGTMGAYQPNVIVGGAYNASYLLAKTEIVPTETRIEEDYWIAGLEYLEANGADVVTSSLGYVDWYTQSQLNGQTAVTTIAALAAAQRGLVITNAAGNEGHDSNPATSHLISPADADLLLTIGGVDANGIAASFSSDGPTADLRVKPELMARGVAAATVRSGSDSGTTTVDGTSFATPIAAAAVTLVLQAHPDWTIEQLRHALFNTASRNGVFDPQYVYGYGIINTLAAVQYSFDKYYTSAASGSFATSTNWTSTGVPSGVHNVYITPSTTLTVTGPTVNTRIHRLTIGGTVGGQSATLQLNGNAAFTIDDKLVLNSTGQIILSNGALTVKGETTNNGTFNLSSNATFAAINGTGSLFAFAPANVSANSVEQNIVSIGGKLTLTNGLTPTTSRVKALTISGGATPTGTLDLGKNALVIDYTGASPIDTIAAQIAYACHDGAWDRAGIKSSNATGTRGVGYAEAASLATIPSLFGSVDSTTLLVRYTLFGDADLSGSVEFDDLLALAQHYETSNTYWFEGDFTYDRFVGFDDLLLLAQNYESTLLDGQLGAIAQIGGTTFSSDWTLARGLVPEPAIGLMMIPVFAVSRRKR